MDLLTDIGTNTQGRTDGKDGTEMKGRRRNVCRFPPHSFPTYQSCAKKISALKTCLAWQEFGSDRNRICVQGLSQTAFRKLSVPTEIVFVWKVYAAAHLRGFGSEKLRFFTFRLASKGFRFQIICVFLHFGSAWQNFGSDRNRFCAQGLSRSALKGLRLGKT